MAYPRLPYWFYVGRVSTPVAGPVYVMKGEGEVVEQSGSTVLTPRLKFFAAQHSVSHLVSRGLVKRLKQPKDPKPEVAETKEAAPVAAPASKSEKPALGGALATQADPGAEQSAPDDVTDPESQGSDGGVVASDAGDGEAGDSSEPEEQETARSGRRRSRRS